VKNVRLFFIFTGRTQLSVTGNVYGIVESKLFRFFSTKNMLEKPEEKTCFPTQSVYKEHVFCLAAREGELVPLEWKPGFGEA
jgi:hypothetical protein